MIEKNWIRIGNHIFECTASGMSFQEFCDTIEDMVFDEMVESQSGELLLPLFRFFDTETRPLTAIEFCDFWEGLDIFDQLPFLLFAENNLVPATKGN